MKNSVDYALFSLMTSERSLVSLSFCCEVSFPLSLSFLCSRRCTFVPYPLTVSEYPELVLRVVNGTLGE